MCVCWKIRFPKATISPEVLKRIWSLQTGMTQTSLRKKRCSGRRGVFQHNFIFESVLSVDKWKWNRHEDFLNFLYKHSFGECFIDEYCNYTASIPSPHSDFFHDKRVQKLLCKLVGWPSESWKSGLNREGKPGAEHTKHVQNPECFKKARKRHQAASGWVHQPKPAHLSYTPRTHMVGKSWLPQAILWTPHRHCGMFTHTQVHMHTRVHADAQMHAHVHTHMQ